MQTFTLILGLVFGLALLQVTLAQNKGKGKGKGKDKDKDKDKGNASRGGGGGGSEGDEPGVGGCGKPAWRKPIICEVNNGTTDTCTHGNSACPPGMICSDIITACDDGIATFKLCEPEVECEEDDDCPVGFSCDDERHCKQDPCEVDDDCPDGYVCNNRTRPEELLPILPLECDNSDECPKGFECDDGGNCALECDGSDVAQCVPSDKCEHPCPSSKSEGSNEDDSKEKSSSGSKGKSSSGSNEKSGSGSKGKNGGGSKGKNGRSSKGKGRGSKEKNGRSSKGKGRGSKGKSGNGDSKAKGSKGKSRQ